MATGFINQPIPEKCYNLEKLGLNTNTDIFDVLSAMPNGSIFIDRIENVGQTTIPNSVSINGVVVILKATNTRALALTGPSSASTSFSAPQLYIASLKNRSADTTKWVGWKEVSLV